ncbi:MAG: ACT domain-containing protein, partial [Bacteroidales bacterium]
ATACKRDVTVIDITSTRMLMAHGFLRRVFEVFDRHATAVDVVTTSEVSVSVTIDDARALDAIVEDLGSFADVSFERGLGLVCAVGENLRTDPALCASVIGAVAELPLRMVSQAGSRQNITFVVAQADLATAVQRLHYRFFEASGGAAQPAAAPDSKEPAL